MRIFAKIICFLIFATGGAGSGFASIINVNCDFLSISNAVLHTAQEGDTVLIGAGDATFTSSIIINRNISFSIAGSGTNLTTLRSSGSMNGVLLVTSNSTNVFTIRDLNIVSSPGDKYFLMLGGANFRGPYHVFNIRMTNVIGRSIAVGYGTAYGCIDHVYGVAAVGFAEMVDFNGPGNSAWTNAIPFGTTSANYVEDCYFKTTPSVGGPGNGCFDAYDGAQFVFRHNLQDGTMATGGHGYDSGLCSPRSWEIYNNLFTNTTQSWPAVNFRGGSGVAFGNTVVGKANSTVAITYYRSCPTAHDYESGNLATGAYYKYLPLGQPGQPYYIYFTGNTNDGGGRYKYFNGNPTEGQYIALGFTRYTFTTNFARLAYGTGNVSGNGGGGVKIGSTLSQTISNLYQAVNLVPAGAGVAYSNTFGVPYQVGHDFLATGFTATNLILINALDSYTNAFGYPAYQQSGTITSFPVTGPNFHQNATLWPCYAWSNTLNGASSQFLVQNDTCNNMANLIKLNRDYFNDVIPAPNVYRPLIYPHPLTSVGSGPVNRAPVASIAASPTNGAAPLQVAFSSNGSSDPEGTALSFNWTFGDGSTSTAANPAHTYQSAGTYFAQFTVSDGTNTTASLPLSVSVSTTPPPSGLTFAADSGAISGPFVVTNGTLYQMLSSEVSDGGRAVYTFAVTNAGDYSISATVNAPGGGANSFFVNIDTEPVDPTMIWDLPLTSGFEVRHVSWRGNGTDGDDQFDPVFFSLSSGTHQLILRGREGNTQIRSLSLVRRALPPVGFRIQ